MIPQHGTLEISRSRLAHNVALLRQRVGERTQLCATLKADAYGHGVDLLAPLLRSAGIKWAAVYSLPEAMALAPYQFNTLVLAPVVLPEHRNQADGHFKKDRIREIVAQGIRLNVCDRRTALTLSLLADGCFQLGGKLRIHMQVDTGLTRQGVDPEEAAALAHDLATFPALQLEGIFSHLSHGDVPHHETLADQLSVLRAVAEPLRQKFPDFMLHLQNSGGAMNLSPTEFDMVRVGIALYGLQPSTDDPIAALQPIARVTAPIIALHRRPAGTGVGYGHTFVTQRPSLLGVVPVGYADGYPRLMSNRGVAQIRGIDVPVVGRVSMDQIILDLTDLPTADDGGWIGERATVVSWDAGAPNSLDAMAGTSGTIGYELATHLGARLARVIVD